MTQARTNANGVGSPSPLDHWIDAMLRMFAELVSHLVRPFRYKPKTRTAECDGGPVRTLDANDVPEMNKRSSNNRTTTAAVGVIATHDDSPEGLILRTRPTNVGRVDSKDEAGLTGEHEQQQQQQQNNYAATLSSLNKVRARNSFNASFLGKRSASRESRFEMRGNSQLSHRLPNQDSRDALRLPENDELLGLRPISAA